MCGHFPEGVQTFEKKSIVGETKGEWYVRQMLGSANISGSNAMHMMTGNLSFQIEHHLFPDLPSNRYKEIAPKVKDVFERYGLEYIDRLAAPPGRLGLAQGDPPVAAQQLHGHQRAPHRAAPARGAPGRCLSDLTARRIVRDVPLLSPDMSNWNVSDYRNVQGWQGCQARRAWRSARRSSRSWWPRRSTGYRPSWPTLMDNVVVLVEPEPPADEPGLLGLYYGVPLTERDSGYTFREPDRIFVYRGPLTRLCRRRSSWSRRSGSPWSTRSRTTSASTTRPCTTSATPEPSPPPTLSPSSRTCSGDGGPPSSSGPGPRPFTAVARVRIPLGVRIRKRTRSWVSIPWLRKRREVRTIQAP